MLNVNLDNDEKKIIKESVKIYAQLVMQRSGAASSQTVLSKIKTLLEKIDADAAEDSYGKMKGITNEQFDNVCRSCDKFINNCTDAVAKKFPGKCDPILKYEHNKIIERTTNG